MQTFSGWALGQNVTVLASGYHNPSKGALGSGICHGREGILNYTIYHAMDHSKIITAHISPLETEVSLASSEGKLIRLDCY